MTLAVRTVLLATALFIVATATAASAETTRIYCATKDGSEYVPKTAPRRCTVFGPGGTFGGGVNLVNLRWQGWGGASARAKGVERGFHLPFSRIRASVTAYRRKRDCTGRLAYTRLRARSKYGTTRVRVATCRGPAD
jgi:hypothetical protein